MALSNSLSNGGEYVQPATLCVELNKGEFLDSKVVRLQKGWTLRFKRGLGLVGCEARVEICDSDTVLHFPGLTALRTLDEDDVRDFKCDNFGAFKYEFFLAGEPNKAVGRGYFCVVPQWSIADGSRVLSLNSLCITTHISKLLGPMREWKERLRVVKESGYNAIHFTPVQKLGVSKSAYSIADYHQLNPAFEADFNELKALVEELEREHVLSIQDVVWNHCAKNAEWIWEHPECGYNCQNSPHLRPAFVVDRALQQLSREIAEGKWEARGVPSLIDSQHHLASLRSLLEEIVFPNLRLHEFFQIATEKWVEEFKKRGHEANQDSTGVDGNAEKRVTLRQDPEYRRFGASVDLELAMRVCKDAAEFQACLEGLNIASRNMVSSRVSSAINALIGHVSYERVAGEGLRRGAVTSKHPLTTQYFLCPRDHQPAPWEKEEQLAYDNKVAPYFLACNGWVMNADPLANFAEASDSSNVYLWRELVCWGDCVKLNYGMNPEDSPYLWDYMKKYTEKCAEIFHGLRIDNCHSTPIHVAEYLLKDARRVRKDLYVMAELFTGSEELDNLFVNRLGITSLIRESQNAPDSHEQGRFVFRYGGDPVGAFRNKSTRPAPAEVAHALFYDQTHDNPSAFEKRTAYDYVPTAAMTAMAYCASGSTRGYDEFIPYPIHVVHEERLYHTWKELTQSGANNNPGLVKARRLFNDLHVYLADAGFSETFVDQVNEDVVAITRHHPVTHESVLLIAHTCFSKFKWNPECKPIAIADDIVDILFEVKTVEDSSKQGSHELGKSKRLEGLPNFSVEIYQHVALDKCSAVEIREGRIHFKLFTSGSVVAFKINPKPETTSACQAIEAIVNSESTRTELLSYLGELNLPTFTYLLYQCEAEEQASHGEGAYDVSNYGKLVYCGLQGVATPLRRIQETNDLGHPICANLRDGNWLSDYIVRRMQRLPSLTKIAKLFERCLSLLASGVPHYLRPCYFELLFTYLHSAIEQTALEKIPSYSSLPDLLITRELVLSSLAFVSSIPNAGLPPYEEHSESDCPSIAAGLPHFAEGIWRCWGRDTFIALPGILLLTGRFEEAKHIVLAFAATLRHGLIPNLLAEGKTPRYNCRDAIWFWLVSILRYIRMAPKGWEILSERVARLYPHDDSEYGSEKKIECLHETMYEALQRHFKGIDFRERNAGNRIDEHMSEHGFNVTAYIDKQSGLICGGNAWNCGTWMDKMGSSEKAGNRGQPATPRDGAAVELQGLALFVAEELEALSGSEKFPHKQLHDDTMGGVSWTWKEWGEKIRTSFGQQFFVPDDCSEKLANRRGIVKDTVGAANGYGDFQLRPNFCIALDAVPDILSGEKAWRALEVASDWLGGDLGIATLDRGDWAYNGSYNNDDDGTNKQTARGWNYHQGPEWVWVAAIYLSARLKVAHLLKEQGNGDPWRDVVEEMKGKIHRYTKHLSYESAWRSLPELTNRDGATCMHSCPAQAWSVGCLLDTLTTFNSLLR